MTDQAQPTAVLSTHECWERLRSSPVGRLAVVVDGHPEIFPVNHLVDGGSVVFRTAEGTKLSSTVGHPIALEVDGYDLAEATAWSVVLKGVGHEVQDTDEVIDLLGSELAPWEEGRKPRVVRVQPTSVSGRLVHVQGGAHQGAGPV